MIKKIKVKNAQQTLSQTVLLSGKTVGLFVVFLLSLFVVFCGGRR